MDMRVIRARTSDEGGTRKHWGAWHRELAPRIVGVLGGVAGVDNDGEVAALLRFEDEDAAGRCDELMAGSPEWRDFALSLDEPRLVHDLPSARVFGSGRPEEAGFVRIERGKVSEPDALATVAEMMERHVEEGCPDVLCYMLGAEGGYFCRAMFFTSHADATANDDWRPARLQGLADEWQKLVEDVEHLDLPEPWHLPATIYATPIEEPRPRSGDRADPRLVAILDELLSGAQVLDGAALVGSSGLPIASALPSDLNEDRFAAMSASLVAFGERALEEIARGELKHTLIEGDAGYLIATAAGPGRTLVALAPKEAHLGLVLFEVRRAAANVALIDETIPAEKNTLV